MSKTRDPKNETESKQDVSGEHTVGTGVGAAAGAVAGVAIGAAMGGPVGALAAGALGAVSGALAGHSTAAAVNPMEEEAYWRENYIKRDDAWHRLRD